MTTRTVRAVAEATTDRQTGSRQRGCDRRDHAGRGDLWADLGAGRRGDELLPVAGCLLHVGLVDLGHRAGVGDVGAERSSTRAANIAHFTDYVHFEP